MPHGQDHNPTASASPLISARRDYYWYGTLTVSNWLTPQPQSANASPFVSTGTLARLAVGH